MEPSLESLVLDWDGLIMSLAKKRCRQVGAELDDLVQEARLEVLTRYMMGSIPTEQNIINALRRYLRAVREGRTIEYGPPISSIQSLRP